MSYTIPFHDPLPELSLAIDATLKAGHVIMKIYKKGFKSKFKFDKEPITEADIISNNIIQNIVSQYNYPILSEENKDNKKRLSNKKVWIIDPLDGTSDFVNKTGEFTVMIGLVTNQIPVIGIIYWPMKRILYVAQQNKGSFQLFNGKWSKLSTSNISQLEECRVTCSRHHLSDNEKKFLRFLKIKRQTHRGSSLKVIDVASGSADLYFTTTNKIKHWDTCASYCLIKEAGGKITDMLGKEIIYNTEDVQHASGILVSNGLIHEKIISLYRQFNK